MNEFYKTPKSDLINPKATYAKPHILWKFYFWFNIALALILVLALFVLETVGTLDWVDMFTFPLTLIALHGYAYSKKYANQKAWRMFYSTYLLWAIFYNVIAAYVLKIPQFGDIPTLDLWVTLNVLITGIPLLAIYRYAYKSKTMWKS